MTRTKNLINCSLFTALIAEKMKEKTIRGYMTANFTGLLIVYALSLRTRDWGQSTVLC
ncbi:MAG: hypothetical protein SOY73_15280 [Blautia sp.]|nr:hypothetical protein [Blautia sp.]